MSEQTPEKSPSEAERSQPSIEGQARKVIFLTGFQPFERLAPRDDAQDYYRREDKNDVTRIILNEDVFKDMAARDDAPDYIGRVLISNEPPSEKVIQQKATPMAEGELERLLNHIVQDMAPKLSEKEMGRLFAPADEPFQTKINVITDFSKASDVDFYVGRGLFRQPQQPLDKEFFAQTGAVLTARGTGAQVNFVDSRSLSEDQKNTLLHETAAIDWSAEPQQDQNATRLYLPGGDPGDLKCIFYKFMHGLRAGKTEQVHVLGDVENAHLMIGGHAPSEVQPYERGDDYPYTVKRNRLMSTIDFTFWGDKTEAYEAQRAQEQQAGQKSSTVTVNPDRAHGATVMIQAGRESVSYDTQVYRALHPE